MKLWEKEAMAFTGEAGLVEKFTAGEDRRFDILLAKHDVIASAAHAQMLGAAGIISDSESKALCGELELILEQVGKGKFVIEDGVEDVHSQIEILLTRKLGDTGKKIHTARSRNDQVLTALKLFIKEELLEVKAQSRELFDLLLKNAWMHQDKLLPGYTHFQVAMPSSFGLWFGAYAESLAEDVILLDAAFKLADHNPLGSAAGFGASFPVDRHMTTGLLGFSGMNISSVYAQMSRGKSEKAAASALAAIASTLARLSADVCLFMCQDMNFVSFPDHLTTGSSIMPHKKNPDVWEMIRAKCNRIQALPNTITIITANLPSGYHRDFQLQKEILFPAFTELSDCMRMCALMLDHIRVRDGIMEDVKYHQAFTVEDVNRLVQKGVPFRDAYKIIGKAVSDGNYIPDTRVKHTHIGSIGNPGLEEIRKKWTD